MNIILGDSENEKEEEDKESKESEGDLNKILKWEEKGKNEYVELREP